MQKMRLVFGFCIVILLFGCADRRPLRDIREDNVVADNEPIAESIHSAEELKEDAHENADPVKTDTEENKLTQETVNEEENLTEDPYPTEEITKPSWKSIYRDYLYDILTGKEYLMDSHEAYYYIRNPEYPIYYALEDIIGDETPELWIGHSEPERWYVLEYDLSESIMSLVFGDCMIDIYDPDHKKIYGNNGGVFEHYSLYSFVDKDPKFEYSIEEGDSDEGVSYWLDQNTGYENMTELTLKDVTEYDRLYDLALSEYGMKALSPFEITPNNIEKEFGNGVKPDLQNNLSYSTPSYTYENMDDIIIDPSFSAEGSARDTGYSWMWVSDNLKSREDERIFDLNNSLSYEPTEEDHYEKLLHDVKLVDWDNDGIEEYCFYGDINRPGLYFDMAGDVLNAICGYGPFSMGWNGIAYLDEAFWVYDASGNSGKFYSFDKYDSSHRIVDHFCYSISYEYDEYGSDYDGKKTYQKGSDYEHMESISEAEFDAMLGEKGLVYTPFPLPSDKDPGFSDRLYEAIRDFFRGRIPLLSKME